MKISIVSCYFMNNYGSLLQAYALQEYLILQGHNVENINISGISRELNVKKVRYYVREAKDFSVVLNKLGRVKRVALKKIYPAYAQLMGQRDKCVKEFRTNQIILSKAFQNKAEMTTNVQNSDAVVIGSDQLWLPSNIVADYYTLTFVPEHIKKVAYATSFGIPVLPERFCDITRQFLKRIQYLSVREQTGVEIVNNLGIPECKLVCDPTMLLTREQWLELVPNKTVYDEPYILCYFLGARTEHRDFAKRVREITGYKIVALIHCEQYVGNDTGYADYMPYDVGPAEFVNLIRHAKIVLTDSFHGTVFSVINNKQFFNFTRHSDDETLSTNSRIYNLMDILGIRDRANVQQQAIETVMQHPIDYSIVQEKLKAFCEESRKFLNAALAD